MKKFIYAMLLAMFIITSTFAQEKGKNVIKIQPIGYFIGSFSMSYERVIKDKSSLQIDGNYGNINFLGLKINTLGVGGSYRYFFSKMKFAPEGFFVSPTLSLSNISLNMTGTPSNKVSMGIIEGGIVAGYQWIFNSGFQVDLYFGPNYTSVKDVIVPDQDIEDYVGKLSGFGPKLGFTIGYCF